MIYVISGFENGLFRNYLSNRYQYVEHNGSKSVANLITSGVPQGSILDPLLFVAFVNDIAQVSTMFCRLGIQHCIIKYFKPFRIMKLMQSIIILTIVYPAINYY